MPCGHKSDCRCGAWTHSQPQACAGMHHIGTKAGTGTHTEISWPVAVQLVLVHTHHGRAGLRKAGARNVMQQASRPDQEPQPGGQVARRPGGQAAGRYQGSPVQHISSSLQCAVPECAVRGVHHCAVHGVHHCATHIHVTNSCSTPLLSSSTQAGTRGAHHVARFILHTEDCCATLKIAAQHVDWCAAYLYLCAAARPARIAET
jgi:hypothetical protein